MSWLIQTPHESIPKASMYLSRIKDGEAIFVENFEQAKKFNCAKDAKEFIKENELEQCHPLPF